MRSFLKLHPAAQRIVQHYQRIKGVKLPGVPHLKVAKPADLSHEEALQTRVLQKEEARKGRQLHLQPNPSVPPARNLPQAPLPY